MFSSIQEITILLLIILFVFFIPKFLKNRNRSIILKSYSKGSFKLKYRTRLFILGSAFWLLSFVIYIEPWEIDKFIDYVVLGIGPVALFWGICWVRAGDR